MTTPPGAAATIARLCNHYMRQTIVTFEERSIDNAEMARRMDAVRDAGLPWLVADVDGAVVGHACATPWKPRIGYRFTVEVSVCLDPDVAARGIGPALCSRLFELLAGRGIRCVIGGIALPNDSSIALHEKFGLCTLAHFAPQRSQVRTLDRRRVLAEADTRRVKGKG